MAVSFAGLPEASGRELSDLAGFGGDSRYSAPWATCDRRMSPNAGSREFRPAQKLRKEKAGRTPKSITRTSR